jgi:hypothetical protein
MTTPMIFGTGKETTQETLEWWKARDIEDHMALEEPVAQYLPSNTSAYIRNRKSSRFYYSNIKLSLAIAPSKKKKKKQYHKS